MRERNVETMLIFVLYFLLICAIMKGIGQVIRLAAKLAMLLLVALGRIIRLLTGQKSFVRA